HIFLFFFHIYLSKKWLNLSDLNQYIIKKISREIFQFKTTFDDSRKYNLKLNKQERVLELLKKVQATEYLSGPAAKDYIAEEDFKKVNIKLGWMDYSGYKEHNQLFPPFEQNVSIIDLLFNEGPEAIKYLKSFTSTTTK
ncbi:MAG: WbqC family protein, partial [Candidatus Staskawiczbacteria bacterium]|nr:WbqC family protein [Candidatus Staskawiczbacteria bacterium]